MQIGPKTQAAIEAYLKLKASVQDARGAYNRNRDAANAQAQLVNDLQRRLINGENVLDEWRAAWTRMNAMDKMSHPAFYEPLRSVEAALDRAHQAVLSAFGTEHL